MLYEERKFAARLALGASCVTMLALTLVPLSAFAEPHWIKARLGAFEAISDDGRRTAVQSLSQFAQFSFALGTVLGQPELKLDPPLRIIVFKTEKDLAAHCPAQGLREGRDHLMACVVAEGQLPRPLLRELTRKLLEANFPAMPPGIEAGLETFFSTVQSSAVHVTWGTPPPPAERTHDWALLHRVITQPEFSAKARIYLHNLASGMDRPGASRNAFAEEGPKFEGEADAWLAAGVFMPSQAPNRPLNPDRDFNTTVLTSDDGDLMHADLLTAESITTYRDLLRAGKHTLEANEGLGILAIRDGDLPGARAAMDAARKAGTKNFIALTGYAKLESNNLKAIEILTEALTLDPKHAPAHWIYGEKLDDPARRMMEWKQAVALAPRNYEWADRYAQLCLTLNQYAEAGRAWMAASIAAPDEATRDRFLKARTRIDEQRLEDEDELRRREAADKAADIDRLKAKAKKELADLEARASTRPLSAADKDKVVDWFDNGADGTVKGELIRVDCAGKTANLIVKDGEGRIQTILVSDPSQLLIQGGETTLSCGNQKSRRVTVAWKHSTKAARGVLGEATGLEFD